MRVSLVYAYRFRNTSGCKCMRATCLYNHLDKSDFTYMALLDNILERTHAPLSSSVSKPSPCNSRSSSSCSSRACSYSHRFRRPTPTKDPPSVVRILLAANLPPDKSWKRFNNNENASSDALVPTMTILFLCSLSTNKYLFKGEKRAHVRQSEEHTVKS